MSSHDQCHKCGFQIVQNLKNVIPFLLNLIMFISIFKITDFQCGFEPHCVCVHESICSVYVCSYTPYINLIDFPSSVLRWKLVNIITCTSLGKKHNQDNKINLMNIKHLTRFEWESLGEFGLLERPKLNIEALFSVLGRSQSLSE